MITLFDYGPSQNAYKVRLLLNHLEVAYRTQWIGIFEGAGRSAGYLRVSPTGTVPAIQLDDGRVLAESNAILGYLADGTRYLPADAFGRAKAWQWMSFEQERIESTIGALRHWTLTGKLGRRSPELIGMKRSSALRALAILDAELAARPYLLGEAYTIADMSIFAYASRAEEADLSLQPHAALRAWIARVKAQPGFLDVVHSYADDPQSVQELP